MHEFEYDSVKSKYGEIAKLYYMNIDNFIVYIKTKNFYVNIAKDAETKFDTLNYELERLFPNGRNKKVIGSKKIFNR